MTSTSGQTALRAEGTGYAGGGTNDVVQVAYGYGLFTGGLGAHYGALASGATVIPTSAGNTERQIRILREMGTTILCCTPSYAMHIADTALEMALTSRDFHLKAGIHGAEPFSSTSVPSSSASSTTRCSISTAFTETMGPGVPANASSRTAFTWQRTTSLPEIIDPATGKRLPDGEWGEFVLATPDRGGRIARRALPHARHYASWRSSALAAASHKRIDRLHGRTDDMLIIRGVNVFRGRIEDVMKTFDQVPAGTASRSAPTSARWTWSRSRPRRNPDFDFDQTGAIESLQRQISARSRPTSPLASRFASSSPSPSRAAPVRQSASSTRGRGLSDDQADFGLS